MKAFINEINEKETRVGKMYDLVMSDGNIIGAGKFKPKGVAVGDYVSYEFTENGRFKNLKAGSMSKEAPPVGETAPASKPGYTPAANKTQDVISRQSALNSALQFVSILASQGALPLTKAKAANADALEEIVRLYTARFHLQSVGTPMEFPDEDVVGEDLSAAETDGNWDE